MSNFRPQQSREITKLLRRRPKGLRTDTAECFLLRYVFLEALIRLVGRYFRERGGTQKKHVEHDGSLNVEVVKRSLKYFEVLIDDRRVDAVLASPKARRGFKTARELRNGLVHRWDVSDAAEVIDRFDELQGAMNGLVEAISDRVKGGTT
jgi:hypothetical protein